MASKKPLTTMTVKDGLILKTYNNKTEIPVTPPSPRLFGITMELMEMDMINVPIKTKAIEIKVLLFNFIFNSFQNSTNRLNL